MAEETGLVIVSFFAERSPVQKSCKNILTHMRPFQKKGNGFEIWTRDDIKPGRDKEKETKAALARCSVAVLLVSDEFLESSFWQTEAEPLLAAYRERSICLLWQQINPCNCDVYEIDKIEPMVKGKELTQRTDRDREKYEHEISRIIYNKWKDVSAKMSLGYKEINLLPTAKHIEKPMPCDVVALLVWSNGREGGRLRCCWQVWIQKAGDSDYRQIPNDLIGEENYYAKDQLPKLLSLLKRYMGRSLKDVSVLESLQLMSFSMKTGEI